MCALRRIVCEMLQISDSKCGSTISVGDHEYASYAHAVYSFSLPRVIARLVAPVNPLFKTEGEVVDGGFCSQ